jgi:hypothetical protein
VLILRGTVAQIVLVLVASLIWCIIYMQLRPFEKQNDNTLAIISQWAISFTLLGGIVLRVQSNEASSQSAAIDVLLILLNASVIIVTIYGTTLEDRDPLDDLKADAKKVRAKYGIRDSDDTSSRNISTDLNVRLTELSVQDSKSPPSSANYSNFNPMQRTIEQEPKANLETPLNTSDANKRNSALLGSNLFAAARRASAVKAGVPKRNQDNDSDDES